MQLQDMLQKMRNLIRQLGGRPADDAVLVTFLKHRNGNTYEATDDYIKYSEWQHMAKAEIAEQCYLQGKGYGMAPDESATHRKRRHDLRLKAAHEHYLARFPPPPVPKERPGEAVLGEVKLPEHLL